MIQVQVRRQGGAAIMTIPADLLKLIHAEVGTVMRVDVVDGALVARPQECVPTQRYSLDELLQGVTPEMMAALADATAESREGVAVGRELP